MVSTTYFFTALGLALSAAALDITSPSNSSGWFTTGSQDIVWTSVTTDPSNFTIQLVTPASPNNPTTIAENVKTSDGRYIYNVEPSLTAGGQYRVNFISTTNTAGILAQSDFFEVKDGTSTISPSGASASGASAGASASSAAASAAQSSGSAGMLIAPTGMLALVAAALGVLA